jgi:hypothetical protein
MDERGELGQILQVRRTLSGVPMRFHPLLLSVILVVTACPRAGFLPARDIGPGEAATLAVGHSAVIRGTDVRFRVDGISDSRCPADVRCVWAGDAIAVLTLTGAGASRTDTLHLTRAPRTATYGGHVLELMDIQPVPRTPQDGTPRMATVAVGRP